MVPMKHGRLARIKKAYPLWMTILPFGIYVIFLVLPSTAGFTLAFTNWSPYAEHLRFTGFESFTAMFTEKIYGLALANTLIFALATTFGKAFLGLALALALNTAIRSRNLLRTVYFYPAVLSPLVVGLLFAAIFDAKAGLANQLLAGIGLPPVSWLGGRSSALFVFAFGEIWRSTGYAMVIFLAALQGIPAEFYEAAMIDGASAWPRFRGITLPFLMPAVNLVLLTSLLFGLKIFDLVYILTGGGPGYQTETISTLILNQYGQDMYAQSTATNLVFTLLLVAFAFAFQAYQRATEFEA
jgi:raffinose/stachyose/melibiose transport system permease protein